MADEAEIGVINIPGLEDDGDPEFQVAPMVDVLLVLLLFFMATTTTEVMQQTADLTLPLADSAKEKDKGGGDEIQINIEKGFFTIRIGEQVFQKPEDIVPEIQRQKQLSATLKGPNAPFRVLIRSDKDAPFSKVTEIMQACAKAGVPDVVFAVTNPPDQGGAAPAP
ncbi:MAG: biopolymer transporter ExbD [Blastochloris sp.]|nr:biopolymer transporter ExbD [Blastochloris sp.]